MSDVFDIRCGGLDFFGEHGSGDLALCSIGVEVGVQRCVGRNGVLLEVQDSMLASMHGAEGVIATEFMSEGFTMHGILWVSVGKGDIDTCLHVI